MPTGAAGQMLDDLLQLQPSAKEQHQASSLAAATLPDTFATLDDEQNMRMPWFWRLKRKLEAMPLWTRSHSALRYDKLSWSIIQFS